MSVLSEYLKSIGKSEYLEQFDIYYGMLIDWNERMNLTAVTQREEADVKHFIDSAAGGEFMGDSVLDIGAGAGFPSLPLAVLYPQKRFVLADSLNKRVNFLNAVIERLGLKNARAIHARAEDLDKKTLYDTVTARAVAPLNVLTEYCLPFVKTGGAMVAYKSADVDDEIKSAANAVKILGGGKIKIERRQLFGSDITRSFIIVNKLAKTPPQYPRKQNKPRTQPL